MLATQSNLCMSGNELDNDRRIYNPLVTAGFESKRLNSHSSFPAVFYRGQRPQGIQAALSPAWSPRFQRRGVFHRIGGYGGRRAHPLGTMVESWWNAVEANAYASGRSISIPEITSRVLSFEGGPNVSMRIFSLARWRCIAASNCFLPKPAELG
jgi:hypothetical protein